MFGKAGSGIPTPPNTAEIVRKDFAPPERPQWRLSVYALTKEDGNMFAGTDVSAEEMRVLYLRDAAFYLQAVDALFSILNADEQKLLADPYKQHQAMRKGTLEPSNISRLVSEKLNFASSTPPTLSSTSTFGAGSVGNTSGSVFGGGAGSGGGGSVFGEATPLSTSVASTTGSVFGAKTAQATGSVFGGTNQTTNSVFGSGGHIITAFGGTSAVGKTTTSVFGTGSSSAFGNTSSGSVFGAPSLLGASTSTAPPTSSTSVFGNATGGFSFTNNNNKSINTLPNPTPQPLPSSNPTTTTTTTTTTASGSVFGNATGGFSFTSSAPATGSVFGKSAFSATPANANNAFVGGGGASVFGVGTAGAGAGAGTGGATVTATATATGGIKSGMSALNSTGSTPSVNSTLNSANAFGNTEVGASTSSSGGFGVGAKKGGTTVGGFGAGVGAGDGSDDVAPKVNAIGFSIKGGVVGTESTLINQTKIEASQVKVTAAPAKQIVTPATGVSMSEETQKMLKDALEKSKEWSVVYPVQLGVYPEDIEELNASDFRGLEGGVGIPEFVPPEFRV